MAARLVLCLDDMGARGAFHPFGTSPQAGQIDPLKLGEPIAGRSPFDRELDSAVGGQTVYFCSESCRQEFARSSSA
ncbi:MAG: hypothetical protein ABI726_04255 [bacterium]